jgi:hypothetical protein
MQKIFSQRIEDYLFEVYSADRLAIPEKFDSRFFSLALLIDGTRLCNDELFAFAGECLRRGLCYLVAWGPGCERVHDLFDEEVIDDSGNDRYLPANASSDDVVMTTWHAKDTLAQALFFFVYCAFPTQVFEPEWKHRIILSVGNEEWARKSVRYMKAVAASGRPIDDFEEEKEETP